MIAAQLTADWDDSFGPAALSEKRPFCDGCGAHGQCQIRARMMMIGMGTPSSQSRIPRPIVSSDFLRARAPACLSAAIARQIVPR